MTRWWLLLMLAPSDALAQAPDGGFTVVTAARQRPPGGTSLRGGEAAELPLVEHDALKAVQSLPGVSRPPPGSSDVVVWGAAPKETRVLVDDIEVPSLFHLGGYRSVVATALVGRLALEPAAFRADVGRSLGGTVRVETATTAPGLHGEASLDPSDASAAFSAGAERASLAAAGRVSLLAALVKPLLSATDVERFPLPASWDAQLKGTWRPSARDTLTLLGLASADEATREVSSDDPSLARRRTERSSFFRLGLSWRRGEETEVFNVATFVGFDSQGTSLHTPLAEALATQRAWKAGLRARSRSTLGPGLSLAFGFDGLLDASALRHLGPLTRPARELDPIAFGAPLSDVTAADAWSVSAVDAAAYAEGELSLSSVTLTAGLRLSAVGGDVSRRTPKVAATPSLGASQLDLLLEPRAVASWAPSSWLSLSAAGGLTHQAVDPADTSAVFGTPVLHPSRGAHLAVGVATQPVAVVALEATGFYRSTTGLTVRDEAAQAALAQLLRQTGEGRAAGVQLVFRQRPWRGLSSWLSYTLSRSERRVSEVSPWRLSDFDETHVLTASLSQRLGAWRLGARFRWATGLPRTEVVGRVLDLRRGVYEPLYGAVNSTRLGDFLELDLEATYRLQWGPLHLELFVELLNVTNRRNVEEWAYDTTFSQRGELWGLPLFGLLGARAGF